MRRRRSRRRGGRSWGTAVLAALLLATAAFGGGLGAAAFDSADVPRATGVDVTVDEEGAHALDTAGAVHVGATEPLVNVTNRLGRPVNVTVALRDDSTHLGDLVVDGANESDVATFSLAESETQTVELTVPDDGSLAGETAYFRVDASAAGLDVSAPGRSVPVEGNP